MKERKKNKPLRWCIRPESVIEKRKRCSNNKNHLVMRNVVRRKRYKHVVMREKMYYNEKCIVMRMFTLPRLLLSRMEKKVQDRKQGREQKKIQDGKQR
jgi:hypothetical protein